MELVRLQKFLANSGVCSRRNAEQLILDGKIQVNGIVVSELGVKIDIEKDVVTYNNREVKKIDKKIYILLNKPIGYVTTVKEQFGRPAVIDLVKEVNCNLLPVGRLDMYTSGAIILTNDGDFINKVTHPRNEVNKTYNATVRGIVTDIDIHKLENGVEIDNYISGKAKVKILKVDKKNNISRIQINT